MLKISVLPTMPQKPLTYSQNIVVRTYILGNHFKYLLHCILQTPSTQKSVRSMWARRRKGPFTMQLAARRPSGCPRRTPGKRPGGGLATSSLSLDGSCSQGPSTKHPSSITSWPTLIPTRSYRYVINIYHRLYFCATFAWFFRPVFPFGYLLFIHVSTNATDDHKYSPMPSADFDIAEVLVSFSAFIF